MFPAWETAFPRAELPNPGSVFVIPRAVLAIPGADLLFPGADFEIPRGILAFPGRKLPIPGRNLLFPRRVTGIKIRKSNKGAGVALYDSIATYDRGLLYDDTSSPQPTRRRMAKVKLGLKDLADDQIVALANTIKTAMTGNANFTTPNPTLTAIGTLITTAQTKIAAYNSAKAAADTALSDRDTAMVALRNGLSQEADYVQNITGGDGGG
jgi:hypothetical protein